MSRPWAYIGMLPREATPLQSTVLGAGASKARPFFLSLFTDMPRRWLLGNLGLGVPIFSSLRLHSLGREDLVPLSIVQPTTPAISEAARIPSLAASTRGPLSGKARSEMKRLIVKPIPASQLAP